MTSMPRSSLTSLSIFFPCYNDAGTIASLVILAVDVARTITDDFEIIVVDDGSQDASRDILKALQKDCPELTLVLHDHNRGYGGALQSGFNKASKEWVFYTDGDNQYDVRELRRLCEYAGENVDVVNGYKVERSDPLHRILIGKIYHHTMKLLFGLRIRDVDCDFRLIRRRKIQDIPLYFRSGVICVEMVKKMERAGLRFVQVPVQHHFRTHGKSQFFNFPRLVNVAIDIFRLWWRVFIVKETPPPKDLGENT